VQAALYLCGQTPTTGAPQAMVQSLRHFNTIAGTVTNVLQFLRVCPWYVSVLLILLQKLFPTYLEIIK